LAFDTVLEPKRSRFLNVLEQLIDRLQSRPIKGSEEILLKNLLPGASDIAGKWIDKFDIERPAELSVTTKGCRCSLGCNTESEDNTTH
jgi:hypothetical protein